MSSGQGWVKYRKHLINNTDIVENLWRQTRKEQKGWREADTIWLMISKHSKCVRAPWRPSINTASVTNTSATCKHRASGGIHTQTFTFMQSAEAARRSMHRETSYARPAARGRGRLFCNTYTHIGYIIRAHSQSPNSKADADGPNM